MCAEGITVSIGEPNQTYRIFANRAHIEHVHRLRKSVMPKVTIVNQNTEIEVPAGSELRQGLRQAGVQVDIGIDKYLNCRGLGACGTCKIYVKSGMENLSPKGLIEKLNLNFHPMTAFASI